MDMVIISGESIFHCLSNIATPYYKNYVRRAAQPVYSPTPTSNREIIRIIISAFSDLFYSNKPKRIHRASLYNI